MSTNQVQAKRYLPSMFIALVETIFVHQLKMYLVELLKTGNTTLPLSPKYISVNRSC